MPITRIDIATMAPKTQEVTLHKQQENQKPLHDQMQIHQQFNGEIKHNSQMTVKTIKSDNKEYRYDAKEKGNSSYIGSNGSKKKKKDKQDKTKAVRPGSIDIKI